MREINSKVPHTVKMQAWRKLSGFNPFANDRLDLDGVVERIACVYDVDKSAVEELDVSELLPIYFECVNFVNSLVLSKLEKMPKNA